MSETKDIKSIDVHYLHSFVGKFVKIKFKKTALERNGLVYTIDPVSESVVLLTGVDRKLSTCIAMKQAIEEIIILGMPDDVPHINLSSVFVNSVPNRNINPLQKTYVLKWLTISNIPFSDNSDVIEVEGVKINPPYTAEDCISDNPIKLKSLQNIMQTVSQLIDMKDPRLMES